MFSFIRVTVIMMSLHSNRNPETFCGDAASFLTCSSDICKALALLCSTGSEGKRREGKGGTCGLEFALVLSSDPTGVLIKISRRQWDRTLGKGIFLPGQ